MDDRKIVYPTPWKPTFIKGIPRDYAVFAAIIIAVITGIVGKIWMLFGLSPIAWAYGFLKAKEDPEFFTVWAVRWLKLKPTKGNFKGNEYLP
jgi:type IV secretory pathway VirB3-like protein